MLRRGKIIDDSNKVLKSLQKNDFLNYHGQGEGDLKLLTDGIEITRLPWKNHLELKKQKRLKRVEQKFKTLLMVQNDAAIFICWEYTRGQSVACVTLV